MHRGVTRRSFVASGYGVLTAARGAAARRQAPSKQQDLVPMKIVECAGSPDFQAYRKILASPTINTPEPFQGFGGYCGWPTVCRLRNGDLYVTFTAGYFHGSWPTPIDMPPKEALRWKTMNEGRYAWIFDWDAPTGGHIMWIRSRDNGNTWTRPRAFPIVPGAYHLGDLVQLSVGTLLAGARISTNHGYWGHMPTTPLEFARVASNRLPQRIVIFQSRDNGESWSELSRITGPQYVDAPYSIFEAPDGAVLLLAASAWIPYGRAWPIQEDRWVSLLMRSEDRGKTWSVLSVIGSNDRDTTEGTAAYLPDGSIGFPSRPTSSWYQSFDHGRTWTRGRQLFPGRDRKRDRSSTNEETCW